MSSPIMWSTLPPDVTRLIASTLPLRCVFRLLSLDRRTRIILSSPSFWILLTCRYFTSDEHVLHAIRNDVNKLKEVQRDLYSFMKSKFSIETFAEHGYREFLLRRHSPTSYLTDLSGIMRGAISGHQTKIIEAYLPHFDNYQRAAIASHAAKAGNLPLFVQLTPSLRSLSYYGFEAKAIRGAARYASRDNDHERILDLLRIYVERPLYDFHTLLGTLKTGNWYLFEKTRGRLTEITSYFGKERLLHTALEHGNYKMAVTIGGTSVVRQYLGEMFPPRFSAAALERLVMEVPPGLCFQVVMDILIICNDKRLQEILLARDTEEERVKALYLAASCGDMPDVRYLAERVPTKYYENVFVKGACYTYILNFFERYVKLSTAYEDALRLVLNKNVLIADVEGVLSRLLPHIYKEDYIDLVKATKRKIATNYYTDNVRQQRVEMCRLILEY